MKRGTRSWGSTILYCAFCFPFFLFSLSTGSIMFVLVSGFFAAFGVYYIYLSMGASAPPQRSPAPFSIWVLVAANQAALASVLRNTAGWVALLGIVASHGYSYLRNYLGREEYRNVTMMELMQRPYKRIVVTHVFIIFGGFLLMAIKSPLPAIVAFVLIKIGFDAFYHRQERAVLAVVRRKLPIPE